jgi:DNA-binding HxlR family transcriptional regulator
VLTARLRKLDQAGVIERGRYSEHPPRYEYLVTPAAALKDEAAALWVLPPGGFGGWPR